MNIYCTTEFYNEFNKLCRKKSYSNLESLLIKTFFAEDLTINTLIQHGDNLNRNNNTPFIKARIGGRSNYRCYYLIVKNDNVYLSFIHPKTGSLGYSNVDKKKKSRIIKSTIKDIKERNFYKLDVVENQLTFKKLILSNSK